MINLIKYYNLKTCVKIFNYVNDPSHKIWKIVDNGEVHQNKFKISTSEHLYRFIHQHNNPDALYVSISSFLLPQTNRGFLINQKKILENGRYLYPKTGYLIADCVLLSTIYLIDLDCEENLEIAQEDGRKIIREFGNPEILRFSGSKGIHLGYPQKLEHIPDPIKRIRKCQEQKKEMTNRLLKLKLKTVNKLHEGVFNDVFRVIAAEGSIKPSGNIVRSIDVNRFMSESIYDILSLKPIRAKKEEMASDAKKLANDVQGSSAGQNSPATQKYEGKVKAGLMTCPNYYMCVANFVPGLKSNYVPFIKIHKSKRIRLKNIINDLGDILIFEEKNHYWLIGYKLFQKEKLIKIMRKLKASNQMEFQRRYAKFRFSNIIDSNKNEIEQPPRLIRKIKAEKQYTYSKAHYNFFKEFDTMERMYGNDKLKTYKVTMEA